MTILVSTFNTVYRGVVRWETTNLAIAYDTSHSIVEQLRSRISQYMVENSREWNNFAVWIDKTEFQNAIRLSIALERERERSHRSSAIEVAERTRALRPPQLARLGWTLGTRQRVHEMVQGGFARARTQVHGADSTHTFTKGKPLPNSWVTTNGIFTVQRILFRFYLWDVPRCRRCSCPSQKNVVDKPGPVFLTPLPLRWTRTVFLNVVQNKLRSVH